MNNSKSMYEDMTQGEKEVAEYLKELNIWWGYEHPIFVYDEKERPRVWTPDFYLPELGLYIEVCGSKDFDYEYRKNIYFKNRIPIIFIHNYKDERDWKKYLRDAINSIHKKRWDLMKGV